MTIAYPTLDKISKRMSTSSIIFTRYLYEKHYVESALTLSLLNYQKEAALFWAYELYYSGFVEDLYSHFMTIFYDYYYILNTAFEKYLLNILDHGMMYDDITVYFIIVNLLKRKYTLDVLLLKSLALHWENEDDFVPPTCGEEIRICCTHLNDDDEDKQEKEKEDDKNKYSSSSYTIHLSLWFFKDSLKSLDVFLDAIPNVKWKPILQCPYLSILHKKQAFIGRLLLFIKKDSVHIKQCRPIYVNKVENEEEILCMYQTKYDHTHVGHEFEPHEVLLHETHFGFNDEGMEYLSLFHVNQEDVKHALFQQWEQHAYLTPLWKKRFDFYQWNQQQLLFINHDYEEYFYEWYAYCPDEQCHAVQMKLVHRYDANVSVASFIIKYGKLNILQIDSDFFT